MVKTRSSWTGAISLGPVTIPAKLGSATEDTKLPLHLVRKSDGSRIKYTRVAEQDGKEVPWDDTCKGFDAPDGSLVLLTDDDFKRAYGEKNRVAVILMTTELSRVPLMALDSWQHVQPNTGGERSYALLAHALAKTGKVAIVSYAMRQREELAVIQSVDGYLVMASLRWAAGLRKPDFEAPPLNASDAEIGMTEQFVEAVADEFDHASYADPSAGKLMAVISDKLGKGHAITPPVSPDAIVTNGGPGDLESLLRNAVEAAKARKTSLAPAGEQTAPTPIKRRTTRKTA